jgi:hypothetical protein
MTIGWLTAWHKGASSCSTASQEKLLPMHRTRMVSLEDAIDIDTLNIVHAKKAKNLLILLYMWLLTQNHQI